MGKQAPKKSAEGAQFVRYFGPLLDALRGLGGSGTPEEVVERIAADLKVSDEAQNELLPSGEPRYRNQVALVRLRGGAIRRAEVHWYEAQGIGKKEIKRKRYVEENA